MTEMNIKNIYACDLKRYENEIGGRLSENS